MKKILMTMVAALGLAISANAQVYVGGGFAVQGHDNGNDTYTTYKFLPEVGYNLNDKVRFSVGKVLPRMEEKLLRLVLMLVLLLFTPSSSTCLLTVVSATNMNMVIAEPAWIIGLQACVQV